MGTPMSSERGRFAVRMARMEEQLEQLVAAQRETLRLLSRLVRAAEEGGGATPAGERRGALFPRAATPGAGTRRAQRLHTSLLLAGAALKAGLQLPGVRRLLRGYAPVLLALAGGVPQLLHARALSLLAGAYRRALSLRAQHVFDVVPREAVWERVAAAWAAALHFLRAFAAALLAPR